MTLKLNNNLELSCISVVETKIQDYKGGIIDCINIFFSEEDKPLSELYSIFRNPENFSTLSVYKDNKELPLENYNKIIEACIVINDNKNITSKICLKKTDE